LLEHFTNTENNSATSSNKTINDIANNIDAIDIQYHTSTNSNDQFYKDYPLGSSSREAYYGIETVPYTYFDGVVPFNYSGENVPSSEKLMSQALTNPVFNMGIQVAKTSSSMAIDLNVEARQKVENRQLQLFVAIVEKAVKLSSAGLVYDNVLRRFLPSPGGTYINTNWEAGATNAYSFEYNVNDYVVDNDTLVVIAFIQDELTKEILQTVTNDKTTGVTAIKPWLSNDKGLDFIVYPNPVDQRAYFAFGKNPSNNSMIQILNQDGKVIHIMDVPENTTTSYYDFSSIIDGLYYIRWINNNQQKVKKLIVIH
jgi:hypothetical protein